MNRWLKKSLVLCVTFALVLSLLQLSGGRVASAASGLTNENIPVGEYEVDFNYLEDGKSDISVANDYLKIDGSKGKLIVEENGDIWFEHEFNAAYAAWFEYLGARPAGAAKAVIVTESTQDWQNYESAVISAGSAADKKLVRYRIADVAAAQDILMHINATGINYNHWYNVQLSINTSGIEPEATDFAELLSTINSAYTLTGSAQVGTDAGQYPQVAKDALTAAIGSAQAVSVDGSAKQTKVNEAVAALKGAMETLKFSVIPGNAPNDLYYSMLNDTLPEFSRADSYLKKPASAANIGDGAHSVTMTVYQSSIIPDIKVERDSVMASVYNVSEDKEADTRTVRFIVDDLTQKVNAKLHVSVSYPGGVHDTEYSIRLNFNDVNNVELSALVASAASLNGKAEAGTEAGKYPQAAKDTFTAAIAAANAVALNGSDTQDRTDAALITLQAAIEAFKAAVITSGSGGGGTAPSTDGYYFINYTVLENGSNNASIADGYVVKPALLKIQGSSKTVSFTVLQSNEVNNIAINGSSGSIVSQDSAKNTRVVSYPVSSLSGKLSATVRIDWDKYNYHHTYPIQFLFDESTMTPAGDNPSVPGSGTDGNIGSPGLPSPDDDKEEGDDEGTEEGSAGTGSGNGSNSGSGQGTVPFSDVRNHWAADQINRAVELGIVKGFDDGTFRPNAVVSRGEFVTMISRALKLTNQGGASSFTDAGKIPAWAKESALLAEQAGLISGFDDGSFRSGADISRAQLAVIIIRAAKLPLQADAKPTFADASKIPAWATREIAAAEAAGLITGKDNNRFDPEAPATRAEALTMIIRLLDYLAKSEPTP